jgi:uroporphyrinogen-III synthase
MILVIRPEPGCAATVAAGRAVGLAIEACPLFDIQPVAWSIPASEFDGLLLGSANALRHGGPLLDELVDKPVYAVGGATADEARRRGFALARLGDGALQALLDELAGQDLKLLRLAGRERVPLVPPEGVTIQTVTAYDSLARPLPDRIARRLRDGALVLLHSAAAARHFAAECDRHAVHRSDIRLAALSPRIAEAAGGGWADLRSAVAPNEAALLALARDMCHDQRRD